ARIYTFKRQVLEFRRATVPLGAPLARLASAGVPFVHEQSQPFSADELMVFIGDSFVVTVRHGEGAPLAAVRRRLEAETDVLKHG
ncbi:hypothetical protein AAIO99_38765, partial [Streptomyces sp. AC154]